MTYFQAIFYFKIKNLFKYTCILWFNFFLELPEYYVESYESYFLGLLNWTPHCGIKFQHTYPSHATWLSVFWRTILWKLQLWFGVYYCLLVNLLFLNQGHSFRFFMFVANWIWLGTCEPFQAHQICNFQNLVL